MNLPPELISILQSIWAASGVKIIGAHVLLNTALAIAASVRTGEFKLWRLADFLYKKMLPLCLTYYAAQSLGDAAGLAGVGATTWAAIQAALLGDTLNSLQELGLRLPNVVEDATDKALPVTKTIRRLERERVEETARRLKADAGLVSFASLSHIAGGFPPVERIENPDGSVTHTFVAPDDTTRGDG